MLEPRAESSGGIAPCLDCGGVADDQYELVSGHGPLCRTCWEKYPTEDDPEIVAEIHAQAEANRRRWAESWEAFNRA